MLKVMTIVGTRPEIIRLSRVIDKLDRHCAHMLVHTGQNYDYELNEVFFSELGIRRPDHFLEAAGATAAETIGQVIMAADRVLQQQLGRHSGQAPQSADLSHGSRQPLL
jgi:UDP-N-acetylglucosamine 2-epimerase